MPHVHVVETSPFKWTFSILARSLIYTEPSENFPKFIQEYEDSTLGIPPI